MSSTSQSESKPGTKRVLTNALVVIGLFTITNITRLDPQRVLANLNSVDTYYRFYQHDHQTAKPKNDGKSARLLTRTNDLLPLQTLTRGDDVSSLECPAPLIPLPNYIPNRTNNTATPRRIPRIIHMTMKSRCAPQDVVETLDRWKTQFPYHEIYFHDDEAVDALLDGDWHEFPHLRKLMNCVKYKGAMKIDVWRILVVYLYGGMYTDIDVWPSTQFTETQPIGVNDDAFFMSDNWNRPSQWFFAMIPTHPIAYFTLYEIMARLRALDNLATVKVVFVTGPDALKHGYGQALSWGFVPNGPKVDIFQAGTHVGYHNKTATKVARSDVYTIPGGMNELVPHNGTMISKKERLHLQSGIIHWAYMDRSNVYQGSCIQYLYDLDHEDHQQY
ncbi:glycosyltransferase [Seminavis robusta]|uniref:Glycosyltransferase n=1 Tax=Seminavis robusta TaxID=568900 RepID=A0A9N8HLY4_9STRA|nr:glycosyltransferase [Seminavis robusta]|eukprot:Sro862_g212510.1 glycosyltransferase (388) ;mRNA; r:38855-40018